jgi:hypothetical protein
MCIKQNYQLKITNIVFKIRDLIDHPPIGTYFPPDTTNCFNVQQEMRVPGVAAWMRDG